jgi:putative transposase
VARKPRIHFANALYHVIARGNQRQSVFLHDKDFARYRSLLSEYKFRYGFRLYAYALMGNHVHLLVEVGTIPLSKIMQGLQFRYTRYFNRRYGKEGHLFQGRYKAILCDKDSYLLELVRYIHLNPVRSKVVTRPEEYQWVSHLEYLSEVKDDLVDREVVLGQFGRSKRKARRQYRQFILDGLGLGHEDRYYGVKDQRFLGGDEFVERIESEKQTDGPALYEIPLEEIVKEVGKNMGITQDKIGSLSRNREGAYGRSLVAYVARKLSGCFVKDIARYLHREPMTISQGIIKVERVLREDEDLAKKVREIEKKLVQTRRKKYLITNA